MKKLYKFNCYCGRMGDLNGIFAANSEDMEALIDKEIFFGEVLGKHSEITVLIEKDMLTELTDDQEFIEKFEEFKCESGYNPLSYYDEY